MITQPASNLRMVARGEDDHVEAAFGEPFEKPLGAGPRGVPMIGVLPAGVGIEHAIQIDAHDWQARVLEIGLPGLPRHRDQITIFVPACDHILMTTTDPRKAAEESLEALVASVSTQPHSATRDAFLEECAALRVAIRAFHMEAIRFRMFNVDRLINRGSVVLPDEASHAFGEVRRQLEAAGFHTRSHQAPS
jgi:hypothetical protein